jgi:uncharacterized protein YoxC
MIENEIITIIISLMIIAVIVLCVWLREVKREHDRMLKSTKKED